MFKNIISIKILGFIILASFLIWTGCKNSDKQNIENLQFAPLYHDAVKSVTDVIVHDIFSPPVASRIYAYSFIAGYEASIIENNEYISLAGKIKHMPVLKIDQKFPSANTQIASIFAFLNTAKNFIFSEDSITASHEKLKIKLGEMGVATSVIKESEQLATVISQQIIAWSGQDMYKQSRSFPKFPVTGDKGRWQPTPPGYIEAIEPSWSKIRPMIMDSASMFKPVPPPVYNMENPGSAFYKDVMDVYETVKNATEEQVSIAQFWDCNPFAFNVSGHVMHAVKKISPGGHWINITALACKKSNFNLVQTTHAYALVSIGLFDAFISCWDEKYRSNLIRPETVINDYVDKDWRPLLQTPPFPEYTSGHSVASAASSVILTKIFGENYSFDDDTEVEFGLPVRSFTDFRQAADEAAISRLYGGIHYRPAIINGVDQGKKVGVKVLDTLL